MTIDFSKSIDEIKNLPWDIPSSQEEKLRIFNLLVQNDSLWSEFMNRLAIDCSTNFDGTWDFKNDGPLGIIEIIND